MSSLACCPAQPTSRFLAARAQVRTFLRRVALAVAVRAERRALMSLDAATLKDMGFNGGQAQCEYGRSFWDVPVDRLHC